MKHIPYEQWLAYIDDEIDEDIRTTYETHLYQCDTCLTFYMDALETVEMNEPKLTTDTIMIKINQQFDIDTKSTDLPSHAHKKTLLHYAVAAAMTLVLMSSGIFSQVTNMTHDIEVDEPSFVTELLNSSFSIIKQVTFKERE